jgi:DNA-binding transcriptional LysR family regulator
MHMVHEPKLSAVDLNLLVALHALLSERHVTRAARQLGLSQSATSHALGRLRELYGDPLLVRNGRNLDLTPRAAALLPQLRRGLSELEGSLRVEEAFDPGRARFALRIGTADYGQAILSGPLLALLRAEAPGVDLQATSYPEVFEQLEAGTLDFALVAKMKLPRSLLEQRLFSDGFVCMLRQGHPALKKRKHLSFAQYLELEHLLVAPGGTPGSYVDAELGRRGHTRRVALQVSSFLVAPQVVAETDLISTGPELLLRRMSKHYPVVLLAPPLAIPRFELCLIWHSRRDHDPAHTWMRNAIARAAKTAGI